eukprot:CAMPEP_0178621120 /NCGR_PEP_ID=MMETSP0698-20121128/5644_1 /TAXON_ID=265572 /ORGANISM="Extubocellulus spinifer, Strain CCMP396" /LENGTH=127 /DNA_ID=CAMNT_0020260133 /DNA_START=256 /DNA_END=636 /DNA_ORIENTATION=+
MRELVPIHDFLHRNAASNLGVHGETDDGNSGRNLVSGREGGGYHSAADLNLGIDAAFTITGWTAATKREAGRTGLAAHLAVEAADTNSTAAATSPSRAAVSAAGGTAKRKLLLVDSVFVGHRDYYVM